MRNAFSLIALTALLTACGQAEEPASAPETAAEPAVVTQASPEALDQAGLRDVCRAAIATVNELPVALIDVDGVETLDEGEAVNLSWRAPVDGGRAQAQCRVEGDVVVWRLTGLPDPEAQVWRTGPTDPIVRYVREGEAVTIIQTLPDGTSSQAQVSVNTEEEAR